MRYEVFLLFFKNTDKVGHIILNFTHTRKPSIRKCMLMCLRYNGRLFLGLITGNDKILLQNIDFLGEYIPFISFNDDMTKHCPYLFFNDRLDNFCFLDYGMVARRWRKWWLYIAEFWTCNFIHDFPLY